MPAKKKLTHIDPQGAARMVDVSAKAATDRRATARGKLLLSRETLDLIREGRTPKGDVLAAASGSDGEVGVAAENRLNFDEIDAALNKRVDVFGGFDGIGDDDGRLERRRAAIKIGT